MSKNKSLLYQVKGVLQGQLKIGQSRHSSKHGEGTHSPEGIFSWATYNTYLKQCTEFSEWVKNKYNCKTLDQAKQYATEYVEGRVDAGLSAWTTKLDASALAKLYKTTSKDLGIKTPTRHRVNVKRSRGVKNHDKYFSEYNNKDLVGFGKGTGLRRRELGAVTPGDIYKSGGQVFVHVKNGKGGKVREVPVLPEYESHVLDCIKGKSPNEPIFYKIDNRMDEHSYRAEYANAWYVQLARSIDSVPKADKYICRNDKAGVVYEKKAMLQVSRYLGHNRIDVIAQSYLY
ncbi:MAG: hypothetical protein K0R54_3975 [Clostridiaceae bacterium]|jgi:integrase|nr:hypothetical protein [Clostridiaceae bacterium]